MAIDSSSLIAASIPAAILLIFAIGILVLCLKSLKGVRHAEAESTKIREDLAVVIEGFNKIQKSGLVKIGPILQELESLSTRLDTLAGDVKSNAKKASARTVETFTAKAPVEETSGIQDPVALVRALFPKLNTGAADDRERFVGELFQMVSNPVHQDIVKEFLSDSSLLFAGKVHANEEELAETIYGFSRSLYQLLPIVFGETGAVQNVEQLFRKQIRYVAQQDFPEIQIKAAFPNDRFDLKSMKVHKSKSGGSITVTDVHSWIIYKKQNDAASILHQGLVSTE